MSNVMRVVAAASDIIQNSANMVQTTDTSVEAVIATVINVLLWVIGVLCVVMIVYGGIKYVMSGGDSSKTKAAQTTITWAVVGLVVTILAYVIVGFVMDNVGGGGGEKEKDESGVVEGEEETEASEDKKP